MRIAVLLILSSLAISCGDRDVPHDDRGNYDHQRPLPLSYEQQVPLIRKRQMTIRYDCQGVVVSNQLETINSLSKTITVPYENRRNAWTYYVYNRTTKSQGGTVYKDEGKFVIDLSPSIFNMKVDKGINEIEFVFNKCTEIGTTAEGKRACTGQIEVEKEGILQINVLYSSETIPGERRIYKSENECKPAGVE